MPEYKVPGVYQETISNASRSITSMSVNTFGFVGITARGSIDEPIHCTSWNNFIEQCAGGLSSPFMAESDLAYALYKFYQNGGQDAYVSRVYATGIDYAASTESETLSFKAKDPGEWGKDLKIKIAANTLDPTKFDVTVTLNGNFVESFTELSNDKTDYNYAFDIINGQSTAITMPDEGKATLAVGEVTFEYNGTDSYDKVSDTDYKNAIDRLASVDQLGFLYVPGVTTDDTIANIKAFVEQPYQYTYGIVDFPRTAKNTSAMITFRQKVSSDSIAVVGQWGYTVDPLSPSGRERLIPSAGAWCGVESANITANGVQKSCAGVGAVVTGFTHFNWEITLKDLEILNPLGVVSIISKKNIGYCIWGARSTSSDPNYRYITDKLVDNYIDGSIYQGTQWAVFEDNDPDLWDKLKTSVTSFLETARLSGIIKGTSAANSFFVNCDESVNTELVQSQGKVICEYGFAKKKPAEFVIHRVDHAFVEASDTATPTLV